MSVWNRIHAMIIFLQLVKDPNRTDLIFKGVELATKDSDQEPVIALENFVLSNAVFSKMYEENYIPDLPSMTYLRNLPINSFGYQVYKHMHDHGLDFEIFPRLHSRRPVNYLSTRIYQDHDLWHVLLDCGVEVEDELAVQAFGVAQFQSPMGVVIIAGGLLHLLTKAPSRALQAFQKLIAAYHTGKKSNFLLSIKIHELFPLPIEDARKFCGINLEGI